MKILFGIQGTGNGHISRCRVLAKALKKAGADVQYILSGRDPKDYFGMEEFGQYQTLPGISFITQNGKINLRKTVKQIRAIRLLKDIKELDLSPYDLVINDFEPISAWAAHKQNKPCLGISNQAICQYIHPKQYGIVANVIMKYYAPTNQSIGLHWFHFGHPLIPPIIDKLAPSEENGKTVVYLPFESIHEITQLFKPFTQKHQFECFHPDVQTISEFDGVVFQPLSRPVFTQSINQCSGIISNTGFALISEALTLGKKILTKPVNGQFEQLYNAQCLSQLNMATVMYKLDKNIVKQWLAQPSPQPIIYPDVATEMANWIVSGQQEPFTQLSKRLWQQCSFPEHIKQKIKALGYAI